MGVTRAGNAVKMMNANKNDNNQIFIYDPNTKSIQPRNDKNSSLDIVDAGKNRNLTFSRSQDIWNQHFNLAQQQLVNERNLVLDVAGGKDKQGQNVLVWKKHGGLNQKFVVDY